MEYSSLLMVQDASDVLRISRFAFLVATIGLFFIVSLESEENPYAE